MVVENSVILSCFFLNTRIIISYSVELQLTIIEILIGYIKERSGTILDKQ
jgi:hypothetical protein